MLELAILFSFKSYGLTILVSVLGGGALGFLYGGSVEKRAQALLSKTETAINSVSKKV